MELSYLPWPSNTTVGATDSKFVDTRRAGMGPVLRRIPFQSKTNSSIGIVELLDVLLLQSG